MKLVIELSALHSSVLKRIESQLSIHGISFTEFLVMHRLSAAPSKTLRRIDLAESVGLSASGVTRVLKPMEKIHLVEKESNPRDARVKPMMVGWDFIDLGESSIEPLFCE